jgi:hypothetical protein
MSPPWPKLPWAWRCWSSPVGRTIASRCRTDRHWHYSGTRDGHRPDRIRSRLLAGNASDRHVDLQRAHHSLFRLPRSQRCGGNSAMASRFRSCRSVRPPRADVVEGTNAGTKNVNDDPFSEVFGRVGGWPHPLNSELLLDFSGAPLFAVFAKGGCFSVCSFSVFSLSVTRSVISTAAEGSLLPVPFFAARPRICHPERSRGIFICLTI